MGRRMVERRYRSNNGKNLLGYSIRVPSMNAEVYSRRTKGRPIMVGVRISYLGGARKLITTELPEGVDELAALHRIADYLDGDWISDVARGKVAPDAVALS